MTTYQRETFEQAYPDMKDIWPDNYAEIEHINDIPFDPIVEVYRDMDMTGSMRVYTARDGDKLIGYAMYGIVEMQHNRGYKMAGQDVLYIHPDHRGGVVGVRFVEFIHEELAKEDIVEIDQHVKTNHPALGKILEKLGYEPIATVYAYRVKK